MRGLLSAAAVLLIAAAASLLGTPSAQAACTDAQKLLGCTDPPPPPPPAPDPGGQESPDVPLPPPTGKPFGFNLGLRPYGAVNNQDGLAAMGAVGTTHYRYGIAWRGWGEQGSSPSQPVPSEYSYSLGNAPPGSLIGEIDRDYLELVAAGITPIIILSNPPIWATKYARCGDGVYRALHPNECPSNYLSFSKTFPEPEYYPQFRAWVAATAARYPAAVIEGNNEPDDLWARNAHNKIDPSRAAFLQCQLYQATKGVDANRMVLSPSFLDTGYARGYETSVGPGCHDALSIHLYPAHGSGSFGAGSELAATMKGFRDARLAGSDTDPIWVTEVGYSSATSAGETAAADRMGRLLNRLLTMSDVGAVIIHTLRDAPIDQMSSPSNFQYHYGFLREDWTPKPRFCDLVARASGAYAGC